MASLRYIYCTCNSLQEMGAGQENVMTTLSTSNSLPEVGMGQLIVMPTLSTCNSLPDVGMGQLIVILVQEMDSGHKSGI